MRNQIGYSSSGCKNWNLNHILDWRNWCSFAHMKNWKIVPRMDNYYHYDNDLSNMNMVYVVCMCEKHGSGRSSCYELVDFITYVFELSS
jgi:hypothetical protein